MGVTIHYEGIARSEGDVQSILAMVRAEATRLHWPIRDLSSDHGVLERVIDEVERDYQGRVRGLVVQPHAESEPLHFQFGDDRFLQESCKTQFAGASTHVAVVALLRRIAPHFAELKVVDEAHFWETDDVGALEAHFASFDRALATLPAKNPNARTSVRLPSGLIMDALTQPPLGATVTIPAFAVGEWLVCPACDCTCDAPFRPQGSDAEEPELVLGSSLPATVAVPAGEWTARVTAECPQCGRTLHADATFRGSILCAFEPPPRPDTAQNAATPAAAFATQAPVDQPLMRSAPFRPGFRFSLLDGLILACGGLGAVAAARVSVELAVLGAVAVLHFFLFCNVFRVSRPLELLWAACFLVCVGVRELAGAPWSVLGTAVLAMTVLVVWRETRKESYHGILWRRLNPELPTWWARQISAEDD